MLVLQRRLFALERGSRLDGRLPGRVAIACGGREKIVEAGETLLRVRVTDTGAVDSVEVVESSGYETFDSAAIAGARDLRFQPARRDGKRIEVMALTGEGIDNAIAVSARGVFVASDHAMYRFNRAADGRPAIDWREEYDRGSAPKPGTMGHGTGTTPTLVGEDFVAITDNADGRIHVVVFRQQPGEGESGAFCKVPVFGADRGTSENSMVAIGNSLVVENNFGYRGPHEGISAEPGLARIDIHPAQGRCSLGWENMSISAPSSVPKASLANGLIYLYTRDESNPEDMHAWYFTAVDARSGELAFKILTGVGRKFNNHYGSISITPDGAAYIGVMGGVVRVRDGAAPR